MNWRQHIVEIGDCWVWTGPFMKKSIPCIDGKPARKVVWACCEGDLTLLNNLRRLKEKCPNKYCVNPKHHALTNIGGKVL